ncbi:unnamed protein product [Dracunculus medinensis]|uniref:Fibrinogen C-terminal domain-containing protein n=1 Tax=Dracunculus medinensis TaxID=318479 RepID=A0A0N4UEB7_DRAME|nr:unnamed protein product [Dracunculus medinensis]
MDSLEEENPSDIKYEFKKISDMLQWNNFRFTRIEGFCAPLLIPNQILPEKTKDLFLQKQLMKLMRLRANQRQSTLYNVQEGSGHGGDIDYIYIIDDDFPNGDENEKLKREGLRTGLIHAMSNDIAELIDLLNISMQFQQFLSYNLIQNEKSEQMKSELKNCSKILGLEIYSQKAENELLNIAQSDIVMNNQHILFLDDEQKDMITRITINEEALDRLQKQLPKDCAESFGKYQEERTLIKPSSVFPSLFCQCDQEWTIIQQRPYGNAIFNRTFEEYRWFFGKISGDHWIGNEYLHALTKSSAQMVRFEAWDLFGDYRVAYYDNFSVANLSHAYRLNIDGYKQQISNLSNSMEFHNGRSFSTPDRDEDTSSKHCARYYSAGWWFSNCMKVNFNGNHELGIVWFDTDRGDWIHLKRTRISIKPSQIE